MAEECLPCSQLQLGRDASLERRFDCPHLTCNKWGQFCFCLPSPRRVGIPSCDGVRLSAKLSVFQRTTCLQKVGTARLMDGNKRK